MTNKVLEIRSESAIRKQLAEANGKLETLRAVEADADGHVRDLEQRKKELLVRALTGDTESRQKVEELNAEISVATRDHGDALEAVRQVQAEIAELNREMERATLEQKKEAVHAKLSQMIADKRSQRMSRLLSKVWDEAVALIAENNSLPYLVRGLDHELTKHGMIRRLQDLNITLSDALNDRAIGIVQQCLGYREEQLKTLLRDVEATEPKKTTECAAGAAAAGATAGPKFYGSVTEALRAEHIRPNSGKTYGTISEAQRADLMGDRQPDTIAASETFAESAQPGEIGRDFRWLKR